MKKLATQLASISIHLNKIYKKQQVTKQATPLFFNTSLRKQVEIGFIRKEIIKNGKRQRILIIGEM